MRIEHHKELARLHSEPAAGAEHFGSDQPMVLTFSHSLIDDEVNRGRVSVLNAAGESVSIEITISGRYLRLTPVEPLEAGSSYRIVIDGQLRALTRVV